MKLKLSHTPYAEATYGCQSIPGIDLFLPSILGSVPFLRRPDARLMKQGTRIPLKGLFKQEKSLADRWNVNGGPNGAIVFKGYTYATKWGTTCIPYNHHVRVGRLLETQADAVRVKGYVTQQDIDTPFTDHTFATFGGACWDPSYGIAYCDPNLAFEACEEWELADSFDRKQTFGHAYHEQGVDFMRSITSRRSRTRSRPRLRQIATSPACRQDLLEADRGGPADRQWLLQVAEYDERLIPGLPPGRLHRRHLDDERAVNPTEDRLFEDGLPLLHRAPHQ